MDNLDSPEIQKLPQWAEPLRVQIPLMVKEHMIVDDEPARSTAGQLYCKLAANINKAYRHKVYGGNEDLSRQRLTWR